MERLKIPSKKEPLSLVKQLKLIDIARSTYYYKTCGESKENIEIMKQIDKISFDHPTWGSRKIRDFLRLHTKWKKVNRKRIQRLMRLMAIEAIYPQKRLSTPDANRCVFPYLLRHAEITEVNQVWSTDITYIPLKQGFIYLVAIIDWYSKKILSWEISTSMDKHFCESTLEDALRNNPKPIIFNTDQGSQFTSKSFAEKILSQDIRLSMDGKGRCLDNIPIERFWRTLKIDEVYLHEYSTVSEARQRIKRFIEEYNSIRPHESLGGVTPDMVYYANKKVA